MAAEIGGGNGMHPISWAARMGLPVVDADGMGRAFPEVPQVTMEIAGIDPSPCVMTDERGNRVVIRTATGTGWSASPGPRPSSSAARRPPRSTR